MTHLMNPLFAALAAAVCLAGASAQAADRPVRWLRSAVAACCEGSLRSLAPALAEAEAEAEARVRPEAPVTEAVLPGTGRPIESVWGPDERASGMAPEQGGEPQPCPACQLNRLRHVLEESRARLARGKHLIASLEDGGFLGDDDELTILEAFLNACSVWINRGMDQVDPLLSPAQRARFVRALETCNQTIDQTLEAFQAYDAPRRSSSLIAYYQFQAAHELTLLRADNVRLLAQLGQTGGAGD